MPGGAASHELRALACHSRISTSGGKVGLRTPGTTARRFLPGIRAQRRAARVGWAGWERGGEGEREMLLGPPRALPRGRKGACGAAGAPACCGRGSSGAGAPASAGRGERGGPCEQGAAALALWCRTAGRFRRAKRSAPGSPAEPGSFSDPTQQRASLCGSVGSGALATDQLFFCRGRGAGMGQGEVSLLGCRRSAPGKHPGVRGKETAGS